MVYFGIISNILYSNIYYFSKRKARKLSKLMMIRNYLIFNCLLQSKTSLNSEPIIEGTTIKITQRDDYEHFYKFKIMKKIDTILIESDDRSFTKLNREWGFDRFSNFKLIINSPYIKTIGEKAFVGLTGLTSVEIKSDLNTIEYQAFAYSFIESITIKSVETCGYEAFDGCHKLKEVKYDFSVFPMNFFRYCTSLETISLKNVREISSGAFAYCSSLKTIDLTQLDDGIQSIEISSGAFIYSGLEYIKITNKLKQIDSESDYTLSKIDSGAFSYTLLSKIEFVGEGPFNIRFPGTLIKKIVLPNNCKIEKYAFSLCQNVEEVELPDTIDAIPEGTFYQCKNLKKVIAKNVKRIIDKAFYCCYNLETINIPAVTLVGKYAFARCTSLNLNIDDLPLTSIDKYAFMMCSKIRLSSLTFIPDSYAFSFCDSITELKIINYNAENLFYRCKNLKTVNINVSVIPNQMFYKCYSLSNIKFSNNLRSISSGAFAYTGSIEYLNLENCSFGEKCFACSQIKSVKASLTNTGIFYNCSELKSIVIPKHSEHYDPSSLLLCPKLEVKFEEGQQFLSKIDNMIIKTKDNMKTICCILSEYKGEEFTVPEGYSVSGSIFSLNKNVKTLIVNEKLINTNIPKLLLYSSIRTLVYSKELDGLFIGDLRQINISEIVIEYPMVTVQRRIFEGNKNIQSVKFKEPIYHISSWAFSNCVNLREFDFSTVLSIGANAFEYCYSLPNLTFGPNLYSIERRSFQYCKFKSVVFSDKCNSLDLSAFDNCENLEEIDFGSSLPVVDIRNTFAYSKTYESLKKVLFKRMIETKLNEYNSQLDIEIIPPTEEKYKSKIYDYVNGLFINKDTKLIEGIVGKFEKVLTIPEGVISIDEDIFGRSGELSVLKLPESYTYLVNDYNKFDTYRLCLYGNNETYIYINHKDSSHIPTQGCSEEDIPDDWYRDSQKGSENEPSPQKSGLSKTEVALIVVSVLVAIALAAMITLLVLKLKSVTPPDKTEDVEANP